MIELSKGVLDVAAITFAALGVIFYVDWGSSGLETYGEYCRYRRINEPFGVIILFSMTTIVFVISVIWLVVSFSSSHVVESITLL